MPTEAGNLVRYTVSPAQSWVAFEARSTLHGVQGRANGPDGYVEAAPNPDGTLGLDPAPRMHVEFPVESLRSGNGLQDREMWKVIDSKRFPRIAADLRELHPTVVEGQYAASGDITVAGRSRRYYGEINFARAGDGISIEGELEVDIREFGLKPPNLLLVKVEPVVKVRLHLVAARAS